MSDTTTTTEVVEPGTTTEQVEAVQAMEPTEAAKPEKAPKVVKQPEPCTCSRFLLADEAGVGEGEEPALFDTECSATTLRTFAQGHDARLVSFLVNGEFDGLAIRENRGGVVYSYDNAAHAAGSVSEALGGKAEAAIQRLRDAKAVKDAREATRTATREAKAREKADAKLAKDKEKADKAAATAEAKKTAGPKDVAAKVVEGSQEGDAVQGDPSLIKIKVGRGEYDGVVSEVDGKKVVTYRNLRGEEETRDLDLVRVLA